MEFSVKCETFIRLSHVGQIATGLDGQGWAKSVRLENKDGKAFAIATNRAYIVIEYLGETTQPNGYFHLTTDEKLVKQAEIEKAFDGSINVVDNPMLGFASAKTTMGFQFPGNARVVGTGENYIDRWHSIVPKKLPTKTKGAVFIDLPCFYEFVKSAPSGDIVFPSIINLEEPIIMRDINNNNWLGMFSGQVHKGSQPQPATLPEWLK